MDSVTLVIIGVLVGVAVMGVVACWRDQVAYERELRLESARELVRKLSEVLGE